MRKLKHISPSSLGLWEKDREAFFLKHLADFKAPRLPQTDYMSIGSAFDAYVKAELYLAACGRDDPQYEFAALFETQVEEQNRDWALAAGMYAFDAYRISGAYDELLNDILASDYKPQFEFTLSKEIHGVPLLGKPDCRYVDKCGTPVVLDFKVNGFCSKSATSPYKLYRVVRDGWVAEGDLKASRGAGKAHPKYKEMNHNGLMIGSHYLEDTCKDWADQLAIYSWMLDVPVGSEESVIRMEQLVCKPRPDNYHLIRVANHICRISTGWQNSLIKRLCSCWNTITSGYIFDDRMTREESDSRCALLEEQAAGMYATKDDGSIEEWAYARSRSRSR